MHPNVVRALWLALFASLSTACGAFQEPPPGGPPVVAQAAPEDQVCSRDAQCVLVQDCCGCERQGRQLAVRRDRVEALAQASTAECGAVSCTVARSSHVSCRAARAACRGGRCIPAVD